MPVSPENLVSVFQKGFQGCSHFKILHIPKGDLHQPNLTLEHKIVGESGVIAAYLRIDCNSPFIGQQNLLLHMHN